MMFGAFLLMSVFTFHLVSCQSFPNTVNPVGRKVNNEDLLRNLYKTVKKEDEYEKESEYEDEKEDEYDPSFDDYYNYPKANFGQRHFKHRKPLLSYGGSWAKRNTDSNPFRYGNILGNNGGKYSEVSDATRDWLLNYIEHTFTKRAGNGQRRFEDLLRLAGRI